MSILNYSNINIDNSKYNLEYIKNLQTCFAEVPIQSAQEYLTSKKYIRNTTVKNFNIEKNLINKSSDVFTSDADNNETFNKEIVRFLSNTQSLKEFYEYTENCFNLITKIESKRDKINLKYIELTDKIIKDINEGRKKLAIFDLDNTLIHNDFEDISSCDAIIDLELNPPCKMGINIRPFLYDSLNKIKENYYLILFTSSHYLYASKILRYIDPKDELFVCKLYRESCICIRENNENIYIKDLRIFRNIEMGNIVIIDNSVLSFCFQLDNGIPILPFYDNKEDNELKCLVNYLDYLFKFDDIRVENRKVMKLDTFNKTNETLLVEDEYDIILFQSQTEDEIDYNTLFRSNTYNTNSSYDSYNSNLHFQKYKKNINSISEISNSDVSVSDSYLS